ncbi:hypothetical protein Tco_0707346 [Tanacetum coccineum]|uniref:Uncharacterized protein n=1 Tax=Tanacetum coccineum TaxID=301880 RepID=A0ABQ4Y9Z8_9ASTR
MGGARGRAYVIGGGILYSVLWTGVKTSSLRWGVKLSGNIDIEFKIVNEYSVKVARLLKKASVTKQRVGLPRFGTGASWLRSELLDNKSAVCLPASCVSASCLKIPPASYLISAALVPLERVVFAVALKIPTGELPYFFAAVIGSLWRLSLMLLS